MTNDILKENQEFKELEEQYKNGEISETQYYDLKYMKEGGE